MKRLRIQDLGTIFLGGITIIIILLAVVALLTATGVLDSMTSILIDLVMKVAFCLVVITLVMENLKVYRFSSNYEGHEKIGFDEILRSFNVKKLIPMAVVFVIFSKMQLSFNKALMGARNIVVLLIIYSLVRLLLNRFTKYRLASLVQIICETILNN